MSVATWVIDKWLSLSSAAWKALKRAGKRLPGSSSSGSRLPELGDARGIQSADLRTAFKSMFNGWFIFMAPLKQSVKLGRDSHAPPQRRTEWVSDFCWRCGDPPCVSGVDWETPDLRSEWIEKVSGKRLETLCVCWWESEGKGGGRCIRGHLPPSTIHPPPPFFLLRWVPAKRGWW